MKITTKFWAGIGVLAVLSPLGLLLPQVFKAGSAWGEWGLDEIKELTGYTPKGLEQLFGLWNAPIPDYAFKGWGKKPLFDLSLAYIFSAVLGMLLCAGLVFILGKFLAKKE